MYEAVVGGLMNVQVLLAGGSQSQRSTATRSSEISDFDVAARCSCCPRALPSISASAPNFFSTAHAERRHRTIEKWVHRIDRVHWECGEIVLTPRILDSSSSQPITPSHHHFSTPRVGSCSILFGIYPANSRSAIVVNLPSLARRWRDEITIGHRPSVQSTIVLATIRERPDVRERSISRAFQPSKDYRCGRGNLAVIPRFDMGYRPQPLSVCLYRGHHNISPLSSCLHS